MDEKHVAMAAPPNADGPIVPEVTIALQSSLQGPSTTTLPTIPGYEILGVLGRGGMGVVYKARQVGLNRTVALKMILSGVHADNSHLGRFKTEAAAVASLQHPNIVQIYEIGECEGLPYFSLEYCTGGSLDSRLDGTPWQPQPAARLVETLARAMAVAHRKDILHRDLKPANILLADDVKITDFGLAKNMANSDVKPGEELTQSGAIVGTPSYMAPEQARGKTRELGPTTDIYSLGAILYELLTGRPPFRGATPLDTMMQVVNQEPVPPTQLNARTPIDLETICLKCLHKEARRRYPSAEALAEDLRRFQAGEPIAARPVGRIERGRRWCRRNPVVAGLLTAIAILLVLGTGIATYFAIRAGIKADEAMAEKRAADDARADADRQRTAAENSKKQVEAELERSEDLRYFGQIGQAQREWAVENVAGAREMLNSCRRDRRNWEHRYLYTTWFGQHRIVDIGESLHGLAFSSDDRLLAGITGGDILLIDLREERIHRRIKANGPDPLNSIRFSRDGRRIIAASSDHFVQVWDINSGKPLLTLGHRVDGNAISLHPDGKTLVTGCRDNSLILWDIETLEPIRKVTGHGHRVRRIRHDRGGKRLLTLDAGNTVKVWDLDEGKELFSRGTANVGDVAFADDGDTVVITETVLEGERHVFVTSLWTLQGRKVGEWKEKTGKHSVDVAGDNRWCVTSGDGGKVTLWDLREKTEVRALEGLKGVDSEVSFHPEAKYIAGCDDLSNLILWNVADGKQVWAYKSDEGGIFTHPVTFTRDGKQLIASLGKKILVFDVATGKGMQTFPVEDALAAHLTLAVTPDTRRLIVASATDASSQMSVLGLSSGKVLNTVRGPTSSVLDADLSPDGKYLVSAEFSRLDLWDATTGKLVRSFIGESEKGGIPLGPTFSEDGKHLLSGRAASPAKLWEVETGKEVFVWGERSVAHRMVFSPGEDRVIGFSESGVSVWNMTNPDPIFAGNDPNRKEGHVSNDRRLVSFSGSAITLWKIADLGVFKEKELRWHEGIQSAAISPAGRVVTSSADGSLKLWDVSGGEGDGHSPLGGRWVQAVSSDLRSALVRNEAGVALWDVAGAVQKQILAANSPKVQYYTHAGRFNEAGNRMACLLSVTTQPGEGSAANEPTTRMEIRVWESNGRELLCLQEDAGRSFHEVTMNRAGDRILVRAGSPDGSTGLLIVHDVESGGREPSHNARFTIEETGSLYTCAEYSPDGKRIVACNRGNETIRPELIVLDAETGDKLYSFKGTPFAMSCVAFSPDGNRIVGSVDRTLKLIDLESKREIFAVRAHEWGATTVAFSPDGKRIISGAQDRNWLSAVKLWDADTGHELLNMFGGDLGDGGSVLSAGFTSAADRLYYLRSVRFERGGSQSILEVRNAHLSPYEFALTDHGSRISRLAFDAEGQRAVSIAVDSSVKSIELQNGRTTAAFRLSERDGWTIRADSSGHRLLALGRGRDPDARSWKYSVCPVANGIESNEVDLGEFAGEPEFVDMPPNGAALILGFVQRDADGKKVQQSRIVVRNVKSGKTIVDVELPPSDKIHLLRSSPDGETVQAVVETASDRPEEVFGKLLVFNTKTGKLLTTFVAPEKCSLPAVQRADGKVVGMKRSWNVFQQTYESSALVLWDSATGKELHAFPDSGSATLDTVQCTPDGKRLMAALSWKVAFWEVDSGQSLFVINPQKAFADITSLAVSPDGKRLITGDSQGSTTLWLLDVIEERKKAR